MIWNNNYILKHSLRIIFFVASILFFQASFLFADFYKCEVERNEHLSNADQRSQNANDKRAERHSYLISSISEHICSGSISAPTSPYPLISDPTFNHKKRTSIIIKGKTETAYNYLENSGEHADPHGSVSGYISDEKGRPIPDVVIAVQSETCYSGSYVGDVLTDESGYFRIKDIPAGSVYIWANTIGTPFASKHWNDDGGSSFCHTAMPVTVINDMEALNINMALELGGSISGRIVDMKGNTISDLHLYVLSHKYNGAWLAGTDTDSNGEYEIHGLPRGICYITTCNQCTDQSYIDKWWNNYGGTPDQKSAEPVTVNPGRIKSNINFILEEKRKKHHAPNNKVYEGSYSEYDVHPAIVAFYYEETKSCEGTRQ